MNYFKSFYNNKLSYSPGWYGEMPWAPKAEVLLYNDKEGFCIGRMESELPKEVEPMDEKVALAEVESYRDDTTSVMVADKHDRKPARVWVGEDIVNRWKPEVMSSEDNPIEDGAVDAPVEDTPAKTISWIAKGFCGGCMTSHYWTVPLPAGLISKDVRVTVKCPKGFSSVVHIDTSEVISG
jgi:hypothetical protein